MTPTATVGDDRCAVPIYDYHCDHCGHVFSAVQSFKDEALKVCPNCGKLPRRLMSTPSIVFKGSGWYKTDSRSASQKGSSDKDGGKAETSTGSKPETKAEAKTEKPAAKSSEAAS
jgi:putative FmdB family regulatory protein